MRVGLIGTGYWARHTHAAALAAHDEVDFCGVWGRSPEKTASVASSFAVRSYRSPDELFADVDAVSFSVPPDVQAELAVRAASVGCHLLLEKPVALTTGAADELVSTVERFGVRSVVFFTSRFVDNIASWLSDTVGSDEWTAAAVRLATSIYEPDNPFGSSPWRRAHGALWDIGPHALSVVLPVMGPVDHVVAIAGMGDAVDVLLHHVHGAVTSMSLSLTAPPGSRAASTHFFGVRGSAEPPVANSSPLEAMHTCISALIAAEPHAVDVRFGREVVTVLDTAQRALDQYRDQY